MCRNIERANDRTSYRDAPVTRKCFGIEVRCTWVLYIYCCRKLKPMLSEILGLSSVMPDRSVRSSPSIKAFAEFQLRMLQSAVSRVRFWGRTTREGGREREKREKETELFITLSLTHRLMAVSRSLNLLNLSKKVCSRPIHDEANDLVDSICS